MTALVDQRHISTKRIAAGEWLARKQDVPVNISPVRTPQEVTLFFELLVAHLPAGRRSAIDFDGMRDAWNLRVFALCEERSPGCLAKREFVSSAVDGLRLKTSGELKMYAELAAGRLVLHRALTADGEQQALDAMRAALADNSAVAGGWPAALQLPPRLQAGAGASSGASLQLMPAAAGPMLPGVRPAAAPSESLADRVKRWREAAYAVGGSDVTAAQMRAHIETLAHKEGKVEELADRTKDLDNLRHYISGRKRQKQKKQQKGAEKMHGSCPFHEPPSRHRAAHTPRLRSAPRAIQKKPRKLPLRN